MNRRSNEPEREVRTVVIEDIEWRAAGDDEDGPTISGYGAVFNSPSLELMPGFREYVAPGAFTRSLKARGNDIHSYFNHDPSQPLGSTRAGNLTVTEDDKGLRYEVKPPQTSYVTDLAVAMAAKLVRSSSFAFTVQKDEWREDKGMQIRTLLDVDLYEVGPVTRGAYNAATSQVRSMLEAHGIKFDGDEQRDGYDADEILEALSGRAFDETFLSCLIDTSGDIIKYATLALAQAGDPGIVTLANTLITEQQSNIARLRDIQAKIMAGEPATLPPAEQNSVWMVEAAHRARSLELLRLAAV